MSPVSTPSNKEILAKIENLSLSYETQGCVVNNVNFTLYRGQHVALIGRSGSGKSTLAKALCEIPSSAYRVGGAVRHIHSSARRPHTGYIFQDPYDCLNPTMKVGAILKEQFRYCADKKKRGDYQDSAVHLLERLDFAHPSEQLAKFPYQLSRGMCQRIMIALNIILQPSLLICDEPTSALDSDAERQVCNMLRTLPFAPTLFFITHNLHIVSHICDRIMVMESGSIVDDFNIADMHDKERSQITKLFIRAKTGIYHQSAIPSKTFSSTKKGRAVKEIIRLHKVDVSYRSLSPFGIPRHRITVLKELSLVIRQGEVVGIFGKSGRGKSTLLKTMIALLTIDAGRLTVGTHNIDTRRKDQVAMLRQRIQMIFQDPTQSLSPLQSVAQIIAEPLVLRMRREPRHRAATTRLTTTVRALMDEIHLPHALSARYPHQLSTGQRQRVLIARALSLSPTLLLADEPFSALDLLMQEKLIALFRQLQEERAISICIVTHRREVLRTLCHRCYELRDRRLKRID